MIEFDQKPIHAVLFDMDGTMFDTERLRFDTINQASTEICGKPIGEEVLVGSLGLSALRAEALARAHHGADYPYREIRKRADELELAHVRRHGVPIKQGLQAVLERLRRNGLRLAVATSSRRAIAFEYLINGGVLKYFDVTVCGDEVQRGKPHPEIFLKAASALGVDIGDCLIVEDSENGLRSAIAAGGLPVYIHDIKHPASEVRAQAFRRYDRMLDFLQELRGYTEVLPAPRLFDAFPAAQNHKVVGIHGFGAIGGGFLAQIFSHWDGYTRPREIIGVTGDAMIRDLVNAFGKYTIRYGTHAWDEVIRDVRLIDSADEAAVTDMYVRSALVGLAMPEGAIRGQAGVIARGLLARHEAGGDDLVLLIILNKVGGGAFVREAVSAALSAMAPAGTHDAIMARTSFPEAVVNRIVTRVTREALARQARIKLKTFELRSARAAGAEDRAPAPEGESWLDRTRKQLLRATRQARSVENLDLVLFHSEPDMLVYAGKGDPILEEMRQIRTMRDIHQVQKIKSRLWNGPHAILAWYGHLLGYETIGQAMGDRRVVLLLERMIREEIVPVLKGEVPELAGDIPSFIRTFTERCHSSFKDPCLRVGRDPLRKLQRGERVFGSIDGARREGRESQALEYGVALALRYALQHPKDRECLIIQALYQRNGRVADVLTQSEPIDGRACPGLDPVRDAEVIARITAHFDRLGEAGAAHWDWPLEGEQDEPAPAAPEVERRVGMLS